MNAIILSLKRLWAWWKRVAEIIGTFQARVLLTVLYFILLAPLALPLRLFGDPIRRRPTGPTFWIPRSARPASLEEAQRQH
ncbi:MAG: hypothetical protein HY613_03160 [Candidatus Rokubacteria bacterium]|nr:hypothetical protein [Candidatus Rokubacteria bacterium]